MNKSFVGDTSDGGTPGSISNPEVKPISADGSVRATACESRPLPTKLFSIGSLPLIPLAAH